MAVTQQQDGSGSESRYKISLTDIRGVGEAVEQRLREIGIESVEGTHLLRRRSSPSHAKLRDRNVGSDTLAHLRAVGKAVHHTGSDRVEAKHLTHPDARGELPSSFVSLVDEANTETDADDVDDNESESFDPDADELAEAVDAIQAEYEGGYGVQISFEADLARHIHESDRFDQSEHGLPMGVIQSVVRYYHDPETVTAQGDYEPCHGAVLVSFGESLLR